MKYWVVRDSFEEDPKRRIIEPLKPADTKKEGYTKLADIAKDHNLLGHKFEIVKPELALDKGGVYQHLDNSYYIRKLKLVSKEALLGHSLTVVSSMIRKLGYDPENEELWVQFRNGSEYRYGSNNERTMQDKVLYDLLRADSIGQAFHHLVRGNYESRQLR